MTGLIQNNIIPNFYLITGAAETGRSTIGKGITTIISQKSKTVALLDMTHLRKLHVTTTVNKYEKDFDSFQELSQGVLKPLAYGAIDLFSGETYPDPDKVLQLIKGGYFNKYSAVIAIYDTEEAKNVWDMARIIVMVTDFKKRNVAAIKGFLSHIMESKDQEFFMDELIVAANMAANCNLKDRQIEKDLKGTGYHNGPSNSFYVVPWTYEEFTTSINNENEGILEVDSFSKGFRNFLNDISKNIQRQER